MRLSSLSGRARRREMMFKLQSAMAFGLAATASSQGLVTQRNLSLPMAKTIAEAALAACKTKGFNTAVAVVDRAGQVMVILRDEQATAQQVEMARAARRATADRSYARCCPRRPDRRSHPRARAAVPARRSRSRRPTRPRRGSSERASRGYTVATRAPASSAGELDGPSPEPPPRAGTSRTPAGAARARPRRAREPGRSP